MSSLKYRFPTDFSQLEISYVSVSNGKCFLLLVILLCDSVYCQSSQVRHGTSNAMTRTRSPVQASFKNYGKVQARIKYDSKIEQAITAAANFLLNQRRADYGWNSSVSTSRANIALAFAESIKPLPESEKQLMKKQLNIQLSLDLLKSAVKTSLSRLALYINALYATCQDPRSFQGLDLVKLLRTETEKAMSRSFSLPIVLLTLCIAGESDPGDVRMKQLRDIYAASQDRISTKALTLIAWECMVRQNPRYRGEYSNHLREFSKVVYLIDGNLDVYSTALYFQVSNRAFNMAPLYRGNISTLINHMQEDGSFGDLLSTYYAIPALLNSTLLEHRCNRAVSQEESATNTFNMYSGGKTVSYSLWIPTEAYVNTRTVSVNYGENATFYDIMRMAEFRDPTYRFMYDAESGRKRIYSLADTPNDAETGKYWTLYKTTGDFVVNSPKNLKELNKEVNSVVPENGAHYIFWMKHSTVLLV